MESSLSEILQVQRENPQPRKIAWLVGSKETSTTFKKEPWNGLKTCHEKNNKHEDSSGKDTTEDSVAHSVGYVVVVHAIDWASVIDDILPSSGSTSLTKREC